MKKINLAITGCLGRMGQHLIKSSKNKSGISPKKTKKDWPLTGHEIVNKIPEIRDRIISFFEKTSDCLNK